MKIDPSLTALKALGSGLEFPGGPEASRTGRSSTEAFGSALMDAIGEVQGSEAEASRMIQKFSSGEEIDLHEVLLAVNKAELTFKAMMQVRNKLLDAYRDIIRMGV